MVPKFPLYRTRLMCLRKDTITPIGASAPLKTLKTQHMTMSNLASSPVLVGNSAESPPFPLSRYPREGFAVSELSHNSGAFCEEIKLMEPIMAVTITTQ